MPEYFIEWFDPLNPAHMAAYEHLQKTGCWPKGFIPEYMEMPHGWQMLLEAKLSEVFYKEYKNLKLYYDEHERLKHNLNIILHPDPEDRPSAPSFCDLVAYVRDDLEKARNVST